MVHPDSFAGVMPYEVSFHVVFHTPLSRFADSDRLQPSGRSNGEVTYSIIVILTRGDPPIEY